MSLTGIRKSRRRHSRRPRLESGQWNFHWTRPSFDWQKFVTTRKGKALILLCLIIGGITALYPTAAFHSYISVGSVADPSTFIWHDVSPNNDLGGYNFVDASFTTIVKDAHNYRSIDLLPTSTQSAVALSKTPIDTSVVSGKELALLESWAASSLPAGSVSWGVYLTTNKTLPTQNSYDPFSDKSVALLIRYFPGGGGTENKEVLIQHNAADTIQSEYSGGCGGTSTGSCFIGLNYVQDPTVHVLNANVLLNFTGAGGGSTCVDTSTADGSACSISEIINDFAPFTKSFSFSTITPGFNFQANNYYVGFYNTFTASHIYFNFDSSLNQPTFCGIFSGSAADGCNQILNHLPNVTAQLPPNVDTGGFFGPVIKALISIGVFILNAILSFIAFIAPAIQSALTFLESIMVSAFNFIGNAVGLGNVGTTLQTMIGSLINFFASGNFAAIFNNMPAIFSRLIDALAVYFPWLPTALGVALSIVTLAINSIGFLLTIIGFMFTFVSGAFVIYLIAFYFVYTGDNALGGFLAFLETTEWLIFGLGLKYLSFLVNFVIDVFTAIIGFIPKPFIQMVAHALPRIPVVEVNARFIQPSGDMAEIRNGNLLAVALWVSGLLFTDMYESANPALPGSIGALLPSAAAGIQVIKAFIPLLELMTTFTWGAAFLVMPISWFSNALDLGDLPFETAAGAHISGGPGGFRVSKASKRFQGRLEKRFGKQETGVVRGRSPDIPSSGGRFAAAKQSLRTEKTAEEQATS